MSTPFNYNHTDHHDPNYEPSTDCMVNGMDYNDYLFEQSLRRNKIEYRDAKVGSERNY